MGTRTELHWLAYFDFLGFADIVQQSSLFHIRNDYADIMAMAEADKDRRILTYEDMPSQSGGEPILVERHWFSDTFLFYTVASSIGAFIDLEGTARHFFCRAVMHRWPLRGAITIGEFHADKSRGVFLGKALVDAHRCGEKQDWLGYVLTREAVDALAGMSVRGRSMLDIYKRNHYVEHDVPIKKKMPGGEQNLSKSTPMGSSCSEKELVQEQGAPTERLIAYRMNMCSARNNEARREEECYLLTNVVGMRRELESSKAPDHILKKYRNTERFVREQFPLLSK